jgi:hypothetical protein
MPRKLSLVGLALLLNLSCGCDRKTGSEAVTGEASVAMSTNMGKGTLPADFPKDVPIYKEKGAAVAWIRTDDGLTLNLVVSATPADIVKYYREELKKNGWEVTTTGTMQGISVLESKKSQRQCNVIAQKAKKGTDVEVDLK